jgi:hypothetical protein
MNKILRNSSDLTLIGLVGNNTFCTTIQLEILRENYHFGGILCYEEDNITMDLKGGCECGMDERGQGGRPEGHSLEKTNQTLGSIKDGENS